MLEYLHLDAEKDHPRFDNSIRIPSYIVIIASFVTVVEMVMHAYVPAIYEALGVYLPLIVVNCIILGRAEAFAGKNGVCRGFRRKEWCP